MKRIFVFSLFSLFLIALPANVFAQPKQQPADSSLGKAMTAEDAKRVREAMQALGALMGVNEESKQSGAAKEPEREEEKPEKNFADVADKALDLMTRAVTTVAQNLEKVAPWVWQIMIRQQYANAFAKLIVPWGLFLSVFMLTIVLRKTWKPDGEKGKFADSDEQTLAIWIRLVVPVILLFIIAWWGFVRLSDSIQLLINPEYYAIRDLLRMILNPKAM